MPRNLITVERPGSPTASEFETALNAALATILSELIGAVDIILTDRAPNFVRQLKAVIDTETGGTVITNPYKMRVFEGDIDLSAVAAAEAFMAANPTYWFAPIVYRYSDQVARVSTRSLICLFYNESAADGAANWAPGYAAGGGGGAPSGPAGGDLSGTYPNPLVHEGRILASGTSVRRQLSTRLAQLYDVRDYGSVGDNVAYALSAPEAAAFNAQYGVYGLNVSAGQQRDYAGFQAALYRAANTGACVYLPAGVYHMGNAKPSLRWTATPIAGQPERPLIGMIFGDGHDATQLVWSNVATDEPCMELLGESNPHSVRTHMQNLRIYQDATCHARSYCLLVGDCKESFSMYRVYLEGANGMRLKIASSLSYAQLCTHFVECKFDANYGTQWTQAGGEFYAVYPETGGALWDNVRFDSCEFGGLVWCRAWVVSFTNCQFYSNTRRASLYDGCLFAPIGRVIVRDSYFEDYLVAIVLTDGISDMRGATIDSNHFSAVVNEVGSPLPRYAIQIVGFGTNKLGAFHITNNHMNFVPYSPGVNGHHQGEPGFEGVDFRIPGTRVMLANNINIYDPHIPVTLDVTGCYINSFDGSDDPITGVGKTTMTRAQVDRLTANSILIPRAGNGDGAGEVWGESIDNPDANDVNLHGVSSTNYQPTGVIEWLESGIAFEYIAPSLLKKRWGVGLSALSYLELSATEVTTPLPFSSDNIKSGAGSPEAVVVGNPGNIYLNTSGGVGTALWVKETGVATATGWAPLGSTTPPAVEAETTAWIAAVVGNGGTVSAATETIVNNFIVALKANAGLWAKVDNGTARLSLVCGDQLAAALVPILAGGGPALDTGNNLVGGDYVPAVGITGNGANKTIDTISATAAGQTIASGTVLIASTVETPQVSFAMFWSDEPNQEEGYCYTNGEDKNFVYAGSTWIFGLQPDTRRGIWATTTLANAYQPFRNGGRRQATDITTSAPISAAGVYRFLGRAGGGFESLGSLGGYFIGPGLTSSEMRDFCNAMQNAMDALGRSYLSAAEKRPLRAYGDSMTYGAGSTGNANGWVTQYYDSDTTRMCFNGGISGETSLQIRNRLVADAKCADDVVVIMAGTNDYAIDPATVLSNIAAMVAHIVSLGNPRYLVCVPLGSWTDIIGTPGHTDLMTVRSGILAAYPNNSLDTYQTVLDANDGSPTDLADVANGVTPTSERAPGDNPHLNDHGYDVGFMVPIKAFIDARGW